MNDANKRSDSMDEIKYIIDCLNSGKMPNDDIETDLGDYIDGLCEEFCIEAQEKQYIDEYGDTDSERILLYIIDKVNEFEKAKKAPSTIKERFNLLTELIADLSKNNKLNLIFYDGDLTYIHSNMRDSLYYLKNDEEFLVASTPLTDDENWKSVELNKLFGLIDGKIIFESEEHDNEFILTEAHEKAIEEFLKTVYRDEIND